MNSAQCFNAIETLFGFEIQDMAAAQRGVFKLQSSFAADETEVLIFEVTPDSVDMMPESKEYFLFHTYP